MNETIVVLDNVLSKGYGLKVKKRDSHKGGLVVTDVFPNSSASNSKLKIGDYIVKVNNKMVKGGRNKLIAEINESRIPYLSIVIKNEHKAPRHQSFMNLSSLSSLTNSSVQTFRNSKSSIDLNYSFMASQKILDSNFVTEDDLKSFIQLDSNDGFSETCKTPSLPTLEMQQYDFRGDSDSPNSSHKLNDDNLPSPLINPVQITRKQAYRRFTDETDNKSSTVPRFNLKKATHTVSVLQKDPVYTVKKKLIRSEMNSIPIDFANPKCHRLVTSRITNASSGTLSSAPPTKSQTPCPSSSLNASLMSDFLEGSYMSKQASQPILMPSHGPLTDTVSFPSDIEVEMKIIYFQEKIPKPVWKRYILEQEPTGIIFQCLDFDQVSASSLNSTALNPSIVSPELLMNVWNVNNTQKRFYLPIGQNRYDLEINRIASPDEIKISCINPMLEFNINISKLSPPTSSKLFKLLAIQPPEPKAPVIKPKKSISGNDHMKTEVRKPKQSKASENLLMSSLHKTKKVEGVPLVVILCVTIIEEFGLRQEGIYRKSGNIASKRILEEMIATENPEKWSSHDEWTNVNTTSSFLKSILRKYTLFDKDTAIKLSLIKLDLEETGSWDIEKKLQVIMDMIYHINTHFKSHIVPEENKCRLDTFKYLIKHLYRVTLCHEYTKMTAENLATCFVTNLFEDIPSDDDTEYKASNKNVIHENLTKMVAFWISHADTVCELVEEDKEDELSKKILNFLNQKPVTNPNTICTPDNREKDLAALVKERIEYFTETATGSGYSSPNSFTTMNTPDSYFTRTKNSRLYQSVKQPKRNQVRRRNSSGSPIDGIKPLDVKNLGKIGLGSPPLNKKDTWSSRTRKKKEPLSAENLMIDIISLLISGSKKDVPLVVVACIKIIEKFGLDTDGIYRINGRNQDVSILDTLVMNNEAEKLIQENIVRMWANVHNTACLLKKVLKKFCLIRKETWTHMTSQFSDKPNAGDVKNVLKAAAYHLRIEQSKHSLSSSLGKIECDDYKNDAKQCETRFRHGTLRYVLQHLKHVSMHEPRNRMTSNSLAVCFVPVLMEEDLSSDMITINYKCIQIVQLLIDHCDWIFQWDGRPSEDLYGQTMSDSLEKHLKNYEQTSCNILHCKDVTSIADSSEIESLLRELVESSYNFSEINANSLRIFFDNNSMSSFAAAAAKLEN